MENNWWNYCTVWNLDSEHCTNLIFSHMMSFTFSLDDDDDNTIKKYEEREVSKEFKPGDMAFGVGVEIPKLTKIFHLAIKYDDKVRVYTNCRFNKTNHLDSYNNSVMNNLPRAKSNEVSISFLGELEYTPEEYRNIFIDKIIDV